MEILRLREGDICSNHACQSANTFLIDVVVIVVSSSFQQGLREGEGFCKKGLDPHSVSLLQVDMTKVKVDVIRPWIATRVTELLGFEDEVLINFIYGMLDGKVW
jgi:hypothetical protein